MLTHQPPFAYSLALVNRNKEVLVHKSYQGSDAADNFILTVLELAETYLPALSPGVPMEELTKEQKTMLYKENTCYLCDDTMAPSERVLDHDHITGEILGVAHNRCNLRRKETAKLACFCHNFQNYDSHFLIRAINRHVPNGKDCVKAIPLNTQKFKTLTVNNRIEFLDSVSFLPDSLAGLVDSLKKSNGTFPILRQVLVEREEDFAMLTRKGVYPYSFAASEDLLNRTTKLPSIKHFANDLDGTKCSEADYNHAKKVWRQFGCKNMSDYTSLYCLSDVLLLADVVMERRDTMWNLFQLDMSRYLSLPHMALDIMLKMTEAEIELISDIDMNYSLMRNIRGGHSFVNLRYARQKKKGERAEQKPYRNDNSVHYDDGVDEDVSISYLDANNLYGAAMSFPLPYSDFRWLEKEEVDVFDPLQDINEMDGGVGYILEVDLEYPPHLHRKHNDFPLCPETTTIAGEELSPVTRAYMGCLPQHANLDNYTSTKLTATMHERHRYFIHGLNLKFALDQGLVLKKIHRIIAFTQKAFLKEFIDICTKMRKAAPTETIANLWKLLANSVYGKLIENVMKRMNCKFSTTEEEALKRASDPTFKSFMSCGEELAISFHSKRKLKMKQSWALGFSILEISKLIMQRLFYGHVQPKLGGPDKVSLLMSDTDSFLVKVKGMNDLEIGEALKDVMDFSNYPSDHPLHDKSRSKQPGLLKNEMPHCSITEAVAVKSKAYSILTDLQSDNRQVNRAKGVRKSVSTKLPFNLYKDCVFGNISMVEVMQRNIVSKKHSNYLVEGRRIAFSPDDSKRYQLCTLHSVPFGSKFSVGARADVCYFCDSAAMAKMPKTALGTPEPSSRTIDGLCLESTAARMLELQELVDEMTDEDSDDLLDEYFDKVYQVAANK